MIFVRGHRWFQVEPLALSGFLDRIQAAEALRYDGIVIAFIVPE